MRGNNGTETWSETLRDSETDLGEAERDIKSAGWFVQERRGALVFG